MNSNPGFGIKRIPAEFEKHNATWIGWPHNTMDWPGKFTPIPWVYGEISKRIAEGEKLRILVENNEHKSKAISVLKSCHANLDNIEFYSFRTDRGWTRDSGPAFVLNEKDEKTIVDFRFNAWAKYDNYKQDTKLPQFISKKFKLPRISAIYKGREVVLEGGSIDYNGRGTILTTEECLLHPKIQVRNPAFTKEDYSEIFKLYFGASNVLWLGNGISGDDTHGHVDDLCRFVNDDTVVIVSEKKSADTNYSALQENLERIKGMTLEDGSKLQYVELPMPAPLFMKGVRLPASYANFYISNAAVLVPTFNDPNDRIALGILAELITDRPVIGIHSVDLVWGFGTIHCLTREEP